MIRPFLKRRTIVKRIWPFGYRRNYPRRALSVCIAAVCEQGRVVVTATDGASSYDGQVFDIHLAKMCWVRQWMFLHAGLPSNWDLMMQELQREEQRDAGCLNHARIAEVVHRIFQRRLAAWASDPVLMPFDMNMADFKEKGLAVFGEGNVPEIAKAISEASLRFTDQLLLIGWGEGERNFVLHEENRDGSVSHAPAGFAAIGSGAPLALSQLLILGQARHSTVEETLYRVAAAKFAAEHAEGVGESTTLYVTWKQTEHDAEHSSGRFIRSAELRKLRVIWEEWGKPKMPGEFGASASTHFGTLSGILQLSDVPAHVFDEDTRVQRQLQLAKALNARNSRQ